MFKITGSNKNRLKHVGFENIGNYDISKLEYSYIYRLILAGLVPHSANGMTDDKLYYYIRRNPIRIFFIETILL